MAGILIIAHGSRRVETQAAFQRIVARLGGELQQQGLPMQALAYTFLDMAKPSLYESLCDFAQKGITNIKVVPYFLFEGKHTAEDIPAVIEKFCSEYPHISVCLGAVLGEDERLVQILANRVKELL